MKIYIWALIIILILGGVYYYATNKDLVTKSNDSLACYSLEMGEGEIKDIYSLNFEVKGENVEGELKFLPVEKDSKTGPFEGLISPFGSDGETGVIAAWWEASGEGLTNKEQLAIQLSENSASVGFGEMRESDGGEYVYTNPTQISYSLVLPKVDCATI